MNGAFIEVEVREGLFPNERLVVARDYRGTQVGSFVPLDLIEERDQMGIVKVQVLDSQDDLVMIMLPGEEAGPGNNILTVRADRLLSPA